MDQVLRILHLEDDPLDSELVSNQFRKAGLVAHIERVDTLEGFQRALACGKYALILSDFAMPRLDPLEALKLTKRSCPELPYLFLSGTLGEEQAIETLKLGATDYVLKQRIERLVPAVRRALQEAEELHRRKQAEQALRESEQRFRLFVEATTQVVWTTNPRGEVDMAIPAWQAFTGQTEEQARGFGWMDAIRAEDRPRVAEAWQKAFQFGGLYEVEYVLRIHDGSWRNILARGVPVRNPDGTVREYIGACMDITEQKEAEAALRESESFFRQTLESIPGMVFTTRPDGYCDYQSQQWAVYTGVPVSEHLGDGWNRLLHPDDQPRARAAWLAAVERGAPYDLEYRVRRHDGQYEWFKVIGRPIRDAMGQVVRWFGVALNIEALKRAEESLRQSEQRMRATFDEAGVGIVEVDGDDHFIAVNSRTCQIVGRTREQLLSMNVHELTWPEDRDLSDRMNREVHAGVRERIDYEKRYIRGDGSPVWVRVTVSAIRDAEGRWIRSITTIEDISHRKQAEAERDRQYQLLSRLVETSKEIVGEKTLLGVLQKVADAARLLTAARVATSGHGYVGGTFMVGAASRDEGFPVCPPGQTFAIEKGGVYMDLIEKVESLRLTDEQMRAHPAWWGLPQDHVPMCGLLGVKLTDAEGKANGTIMVSCRREGDFCEQDEAILRQLGAITSLALQHIEAREEAEAAKDSAERAKAVAEQANRAKDHFFAVLSHELRTPLTPVVMGVSMLQDRPDLDPQVRETLEMVRRNVEMEARLIDDLLDVTRIARGKIELQKQRVPICTVIQRAVDVCRPDIEARRLHFGVDIGPAAPYWVEADVGRLQQVFWNLLKNAIKFTPHGGCVGIRCRPNEKHIVAEINDSGIGIEPDALARVFNAFEQTERSITRQFGGLGLGLAISKAMVEMHGGTIEAHSEGRDKGATFRIRLPLTEPAGEPDAGAPATAPQGTARPMRILLVEDHGVTAQMMKMVLSLDGHTVETAGDISTALELAARQRFDLLVSDLGLPDGSGHDLMRQLRDRGHRFPGIALSGYGQEEDVQRSHQAGFAAHLTKPASREAILEAIAAVAAREPANSTGPESTEACQPPDQTRIP